MRVTLFLGLVIAVFAVVFAVQNPMQVDVRFLGAEFTGAFALLMLATFAAGFLSSLLLSILPALRRRRRVAALERRLADVEADLEHKKRLLENLTASVPAPVRPPAPKPSSAPLPPAY
jgi:putative membrane protein